MSHPFANIGKNSFKLGGGVSIYRDKKEKRKNWDVSSGQVKSLIEAGFPPCYGKTEKALPK